jgi:hypothetical protein
MLEFRPAYKGLSRLTIRQINRLKSSFKNHVVVEISMEKDTRIAKEYFRSNEIRVVWIEQEEAFINPKANFVYSWMELRRPRDDEVTFGNQCYLFANKDAAMLFKLSN